MRKIIFFLLLFIFISCSQSTNKNTASQNKPAKIQLPSGAIPFDYYEHELYVKVKLNDSIEGYFNFDTGSDQLYLDSTFVSQHHLFAANSKRKKIYGVGVSAPTVPTISKIKLEFDSLVKDCKNVPVINLKALVRNKIEGVFGISIFKNEILKINFDSNYMMVIKPDKFKVPEGYDTVNLFMAGNKTVIKCRVWITDSISVNGYVILDVGSGRGLTFTSIIARKYNLNKIITNKYLETLGNAGYGGISQSYYFTGAVLKISNYKLNKPVFNYSIDKKGALSWWGILGLLGNDVIDRFDLIFDFPKKKLYLKPNTQFYKPFYFPKSADSTKSR